MRLWCDILLKGKHPGYEAGDDDNQKSGLKNQGKLEDLVKNGKAVEATKHRATQPHLAILVE